MTFFKILHGVNLRRMAFPAAIALFCASGLNGAAAAAKAGNPGFELREEKAEEMNSILASVNGEAITLKDVLDESARREYPIYASGSNAENYEAVKKLRRAVVDEIIDRKLLLAEFKRKPFEIPTQYLESFLDDLAQNYGCRTRSELAARLHRDGSSLDEFREKALERLTEQAMIGRQLSAKVNVSPRQVAEYMEKHRIRPSSEIHLYLLLTDETPQLSDAAAFEAYARSKSKAGNRESGGDYSWCRRDRLREEFRRELATAKTGEVRGPVKTAEGNFYLLIRAERMTDETGVTAAAAREAVERAERERVRREYLESLRKDATIKYYF